MRRERAGESAGQALELRRRERFRIDDDPALAAAERDADHSRFDRHPKRKRFDFIKIDGGRVTDAALIRAARAVPLHAIGGKRFLLAGIHLHLEFEMQNTVGRF